MNGISRIVVKNVKGFGENSNPIEDISILPGRINLLVAPNGWGKSSLTAAFASLRQNKLDVSKEDKYKQDETLKSSLSIVLDGNTLIADETKNEIHGKIICKTIRCDTYVKTITQNMGRFSHSKGFVDIQDIEICKVPVKPLVSYSFTGEKNAFGKNGKLLQNHTRTFEEPSFVSLLNKECITTAINNLSKKQIGQTIDGIREHINSLNGNSNIVRNSFNQDTLLPLRKNDSYRILTDAFCRGESELDAFLHVYQIIEFYKKNKAVIPLLSKYNEHCKFKRELDENIRFLNTTWKNIGTKESDGKLMVIFPHADIISNGQRDLLTFSVRLQALKPTLRPKKSYFLLIDEVFDYLDDANVLAAQYYLSDLIKFAKDKNITLSIGIFTHLDPEYFRSYVFNKLNVSYLKSIEAKSTDSMKTFIAFRQSIDRNDQLWNDLSKYCFHYHPNLPRLKRDLELKNGNGTWKNLKTTWGDGESLFKYLLDEVNKYLSNAPHYDPYAVSLAIRIASEKRVYDSFDNPTDKQSFLETWTTKKKMEFAESKGKLIPDAYYILSLIHGESDHISFDKDQKKFNEKPVVYVLGNEVVKHMVALLFDYDGSSVPLEKLH